MLYMYIRDLYTLCDFMRNDSGVSERSEWRIDGYGITNLKLPEFYSTINLLY